MQSGTPYEGREDEFDLGSGSSFTWFTSKGQISPSLLCRTCGNHGFIRDGRWVVA